MLSTPKNHLPKNYPLPTAEEDKKFEPIFTRAFEIHKDAHPFGSYVLTNNNQELGPRTGILSPVKGRTKISRARYCDCYERAYQELHKEILGV